MYIHHLIINGTETVQARIHEIGWQLTNLLILSEAKYIHCLQHLTIQFHVIFTRDYWHIAVGQIAVAADVVFN